MSLNNLANRQAEAGDRDGRAGHQHRSRPATTGTLAEASPAAYLPDLAMSLNNLANHRRRPGTGTAALAASTEAVAHYRSLAEASPAAYLPDLAASLNNLAAASGGRGPGGALAAAPKPSRPPQLAEASPAAYLPDLARSLNNLANHQAGRGPGGRAGHEHQAVQILPHPGRGQPRRLPARPRQVAEQPGQPTRRRPGTGRPRWPRAPKPSSIRRILAEASPAAYLPNLATSLNNLAELSGEAPAAADGFWQEAIAAFSDPLPRAELRAHYAHALSASGKHDAAAEQLAAAAADAASGEAAALGRARRGYPPDGHLLRYPRFAAS